MRWGRNVDLIVTDQHSYRSEEPSGRAEARAAVEPRFPELHPAGGASRSSTRVASTTAAGRRPRSASATTEVPNFRKDAPPQTILGAEQKAWFLERLRASTRDVEGLGQLSGHARLARGSAEPARPACTKPWPGAGYACFGGGDHSAAYVERAEIYDLVRERITGFATVSGDRHSFWAGLAAKALPPAAFEPVGVAFITGSVSAPGLVEAFEHRFPKEHPLRALFLVDRPGGAKPQPAINMLLPHGVRSCLEYAARRATSREARALSNPRPLPAPVVSSTWAATATRPCASPATRSRAEFVCIPRPMERSGRETAGRSATA